MGPVFLAPTASKEIISRADGSNLSTRLFGVVLTIVVSIALGVTIKLCDYIQWWHYILAIIFIPIEILGFMACVGGNIAFQSDKYGRYVDTIGQDGYSASGSGHHYSRDSSGRFFRDF